MEIEKLKGSEQSVCARITAHFITGRNGQIWHKIKREKKTLSAMYFWQKQQQLVTHLGKQRHSNMSTPKAY